MNAATANATNITVQTLANIATLNVFTSSNLAIMNAATANATNLTVQTLANISTLNVSSITAPAAFFSGTPAAAANVLTVIGSSTTGNVVQFSNTVSGGVFIMNSMGEIGIGTTNPAYPLHVTTPAQTKAASAYANLTMQTGGWYQAYNASGATTLKIFTDGNIGCTELDVFSDSRIKKEVTDSDSLANFEAINKLKVRNFKYIDSIEHGTKTYRGLIAQEVREVCPEVVTMHNGTIPDIFQVPKSFDGRRCQFENKIENVKVGSKVKVFDNESERFLEIISFTDFEIEFDNEINGPKVFVYGQNINDLHTVSYDRLVPILISAVQELAKKLGTC